MQQEEEQEVSKTAAASQAPVLEKYLEASQKALAFLVQQLSPSDGMYLGDAQLRGDLGVFYKFPMQLLMGGQGLLCNKLLDVILRDFLQPDGDLLSFPSQAGLGRKTCQEALAYNWPYINGWITMAAQRAFRFDVAQACYGYLKQFSDVSGGYRWTDAASAKGDAENSCCGFMTAHLGLTALVMGDVERAEKAGCFLESLCDKQPDVSKEFLLKMSGGEVVKEFPEDKAGFFVVSRDQPELKVYFMIGYPVIFLVKLHLATRKREFLKTAERIAAFSLSCPEDIVTSQFSHKVAYGMALLFSITKKASYRDFAIRVADSLVTKQGDSGQFFTDWDLAPSLDQTAELSGWLREIYTELSR